MPRALITGIGGQDGSYLAEFLLSKGYEVYGLVRRTPESLSNLQAILPQIEFTYGDLRDSSSLAHAIGRSYPDEIYNLGALSFVPPSWIAPDKTLNVNAGGLARILAVVSAQSQDTKVYQASSSEQFGNQTGALDESSPFHATSPYGVSKVAAHNLIQIYRGKGIRCVGGLLFNHESPRRGREMVTMKICRHVARFACGIREPLKLGNLDACRDWGFAGDYVEAMWLMMREAICDYVIGTGVVHSVSECLDRALDSAGVDREEFHAKWLRVASSLKREGEIDVLCANPSKAERELGWKAKTSFHDMIHQMVQSEMKKVTDAKLS